jgi:hypothetical protein
MCGPVIFLRADFQFTPDQDTSNMFTMKQIHIWQDAPKVLTS